MAVAIYRPKSIVSQASSDRVLRCTRRVVLLECQPPADHYGVSVMACHGEWVAVYKPFANESPRWGLCGSPFGDEEPAVKEIKGIWYWVQK